MTATAPEQFRETMSAFLTPGARIAAAGPQGRDCEVDLESMISPEFPAGRRNPAMRQMTTGAAPRTVIDLVET